MWHGKHSLFGVLAVSLGVTANLGPGASATADRCVKTAQFEVFIDGDRSGKETLCTSVSRDGALEIKIKHKSTYVLVPFFLEYPTKIEATITWKGNELVSARGTGHYKGAGSLPKTEVKVAWSPTKSLYEWSAVEDNGNPVTGEFDAPAQAEWFWRRPSKLQTNIVNLGRSAVYSAKFTPLADQWLPNSGQSVKTHHYQVRGDHILGGRPEDEGLNNFLWYDSIGLVRMCKKNTYKIILYIEFLRLEPAWSAVAADAKDDAAKGVNESSCQEMFN